MAQTFAQSTTRAVVFCMRPHYIRTNRFSSGWSFASYVSMTIKNGWLQRTKTVRPLAIILPWTRRPRTEIKCFKPSLRVQKLRLSSAGSLPNRVILGNSLDQVIIVQVPFNLKHSVPSQSWSFPFHFNV
jgi:hypothetical protein